MKRKAKELEPKTTELNLKNKDSLLQKSDQRMDVHDITIVNVVCRICLVEINIRMSRYYNVCQHWPHAWAGMEDTIADDIQKITGIRISENDPKNICQSCCTRLQGACQFAHFIKLSNQILNQRGVPRISTNEDSVTENINEKEHLLDSDKEAMDKEKITIEDQQELNQDNNESETSIQESDKHNLKTTEEESAKSNSDLHNDSQKFRIQFRQNIFKDEQSKEEFNKQENLYNAIIEQEKLELQNLDSQKPYNLEQNINESTLQDSNIQDSKKEEDNVENTSKPLQNTQEPIIQALKLDIEEIIPILEINHDKYVNNEENTLELKIQESNEHRHLQENNILDRINRESREEELWPQPIQLEQNVSNLIFDGSVEVKQEALSEDEWSYSEDNMNVMDIKVEPVEFLETNIQIVDCHGSVPFDSPIIRKNFEPDNSNMKEEYLEPMIKAEVCSEEEVEQSDLPLNCMLCAKDLRSVSGLKAHVIAQHTYKTIDRQLSKKPRKRERKKRNKHICLICKRMFTTVITAMPPLYPRKYCRHCQQKKDLRDNSKENPSNDLKVYGNNDLVKEENIKKEAENDINVKIEKLDDVVTCPTEINNEGWSNGITGKKQTNKIEDEQNQSSKPPNISPTVQSGCEHTCYYKCNVKFTHRMRLKVRSQFQELNATQKRRYYTEYTVRKKSKKTSRKNSRRKYSFEYYLPNGFKKERVCQKFFIATLSINISSVHKWLERDAAMQTAKDMYKESGGKVSGPVNEDFRGSDWRIRTSEQRKRRQGEVENVVRSPKTEVKKKKKITCPSGFSCNACQKEFNDIYSLRVHAEIHHTISDRTIKLEHSNSDNMVIDVASGMKEEFLDESVFD